MLALASKLMVVVSVTTLGVTQTGDGRLKFNISEGEVVFDEVIGGAEIEAQ